MRQRSVGFSLVELSIVLVILGLLVGGVLSGQSLIHAAQMRSAVTEYQRYIAAVNSFRDKYFALPGDMANATAFWGIAAGTGSDAACRDFVSTDKKTCNGDGNGQIENSVGSYEDARFWQHLANAGLIEGSYVGTWSTWDAMPKSKTGESNYWEPFYWSASAGDPSYFAADYGNYLGFWDATTTYAAMTPEDMWNLDKKIDDGIPGTGKLLSNKGDSTYQCTTQYGQASDTGAVYNLSFPSKSCEPFFIKAF